MPPIQMVPLATRMVFARRFFLLFAIASSLMLMALLIGIAGYHWIVGLPWIDSLLNASMILGGMGPVDTMSAQSAKVFASLYALFSGLVFAGSMGLVISPILHRMLHKFHIDDVDLSSVE